MASIPAEVRNKVIAGLTDEDWKANQTAKLGGKKVDTQVVEIGNKKLLINTQTGAVIKDLGVVPKAAGDGSPLGTIPLGVPPQAPTQPQQTFDQYIAQQEQAAGQSFGPAKRESLRQQFNAQQSQQTQQPKPQADISRFDPTVQMVIKGLKSIDSIGDVEYRKIKNQLNQAYQLGLIQDQPLSGPRQTAFNQLVANYNKSPLIAASDRTPVLKGTIADIRKDPGNGTKQLSLVYSYIQALDTYQSAVREGELGLVNSIDSKIGKLGNYVSQIQNGQIVRPEVAKNIADSAEAIVNYISSAATSKANSYKSQAKVNGLEKQWDQYISGFTPSYAQNQSSAGGGSAQDILSKYGVQ